MADSARPWFRDDVFWITAYPFLFDAARMEAAEGEAEALIALAGGSEGRWLDLGCGPGRHAVALAARGVQVTGIDASPFLLERARARAAAAGTTVELIEADLHDDLSVEPASVDVAISMFTTFGYGDRDDDLRMLTDVRRALRPGGRLVLELAGKECVAAADGSTRCLEGDEGALMFWRHWPIEDWTRVENHWVIVEGERARHLHFDTALYAGNELRELLVAAGFAKVALYSSLDGDPYGAEPERLVALARVE